MPTATILSKTAYNNLCNDIARLLEQARQNTRQTIAREMTRAYWSIGKRIAAEKLTTNGGSTLILFIFRKKNPLCAL